MCFSRVDQINKKNSQYMLNKLNPRPYLENIVKIKFSRNSNAFFYSTGHYENYIESEILSNSQTSWLKNIKFDFKKDDCGIKDDRKQEMAWHKIFLNY